MFDITLAADVQSFEQSVKKQSSRAADKNKKRGKQESESEGDEEKEDDEDLEEMPVKRKVRTLFAFH